MPATSVEQTVQSLDIRKEEKIAAPVEIVFEALLEQLGPLAEAAPGTPMPMKFEPWPGGRWYRDLGNGAGHFWAHVQVIKPPTLLELCGPMFMSYPAANHLQYRLVAEEGGTRLTLHHRAIGLISPAHRDGVQEGWTYILKRIAEAAQRQASSLGASL